MKKKGVEEMKLNFPNKKPNTQTVQFRIDPDTKKKMNELKRYYKVRTGELIKEMINESHKEIPTWTKE